MKVKLNRKEAQEKIEEFFKREDFKPEEVKKIKRLAMKFSINLGQKRKKFCKKCLSKLNGKTRVDKIHKSIKCSACGYVNRFKLRSKKA